jgi:hypothetical protein
MQCFGKIALKMPIWMNYKEIRRYIMIDLKEVDCEDGTVSVLCIMTNFGLNNMEF